MDGARVAKPHLGLGRVHVHVHAQRIELEKQHIGRVPIAVQQVLVGLAQRMREQLVAHEAAVDEGELGIARTARERGRAGKTGKPQAGGKLVERARRAGEFLPRHRGDAPRGIAGLQMRSHPAVVPQAECDIGP